MSSTRKIDPAIEAAAIALHAIAMAGLPEDKRVTWHQASGDERDLARLMFATGLIRWHEAGGRL